MTEINVRKLIKTIKNQSDRSYGVAYAIILYSDIWKKIILMASVHEGILNKCNGEEAALCVINRGFTLPVYPYIK